MRKWLWCVTTLCLAALLAACGEEEPKNPIDWAIDPEVQGEEREILRAALEIVFAECPVLAKIDWEAAAKDEELRKQGAFDPAQFVVTDPKDPYARPEIDGWTHHSSLILAPPQEDSLFVSFSWTEPPGIAVQTSSDHSWNERKKKYASLTRKSKMRNTYGITGSSGSMPWRRS
jgi:hypothetical protein